jgi:hypothetical protein
LGFSTIIVVCVTDCGGLNRSACKLVIFVDIGVFRLAILLILYYQPVTTLFLEIIPSSKA